MKFLRDPSGSSLWELIRELHDAEISHFGRRYSAATRELKAKEILKSKVFNHAKLNCDVLPNEVPALAKEILDNGVANATARHFKALALAKIAYVTDVFAICQNFGCRVFASIVETDTPTGAADGLRKDYGYLFERFFYFLEDEAGSTDIRIMEFWFSTNWKNQRATFSSIRLIVIYLTSTATGRHRASLVIPQNHSFTVT